MSFFDARFCYEHGQHIIRTVYTHPGRPQVQVEISGTRRQLRYTTYHGVVGEWHGDVHESGVIGQLFGQLSDSLYVHKLKFLDFHSPWGFEQPIIFKQAGPVTWHGLHRTNVICKFELVLPPKLLPSPRTLFIPSDASIIIGMDGVGRLECTEPVMEEDEDFIVVDL